MRVVTIGASWGGTDALGVLLARIRPDIAAPVLIVQHRAADAPAGALARFLEKRGTIPVVEPLDKQAMQPGIAYLAPPDYHLLVERGHVALSIDAPVKQARPSIDVLFESAAATYGADVVGVVLTGSNDDGAAGIKAVREAGGTVLVQDRATAVRTEMPDAASAAAGRCITLDLPQIAEALNELAHP